MRSLIIAFVAGLAGSLETISASVAQTEPNPALNNPDEQSWKLFMTVNANAATAGNNNALFETWASDGDTFQATHGSPKPGEPVDLHMQEWKIVGVLAPTHTSIDHVVYIPLNTFYTIAEHGELLETLDDVLPGLQDRTEPLLLEVTVAPDTSFAP